MTDTLKNVRHDYLRYANCWEDAEVLLDGLAVRPGERVLSIGSAGDNSLSLLTQDPAAVVAVDVNAVQLHLIALKVAAFRTLRHPELLRFLGFAAGTDRRALFGRVRAALEPEAAAYWAARPEVIAGGVIYAGKFERYFRLFRERILPWIHGPRRVTELLCEKSATAQQQFFQQHWNTHCWRALFRLFFSRRVMGRLGRDPAFLREVEGSVGARILVTAKNQLQSVACQHNYFLRFILTGRFGVQLPHYARPEHFESIRSRLDRLHLHRGLAESVSATHGPFDAFNLSNIFEYLSPTVFARTAAGLWACAGPAARFAYWNLLVPRSLAAVLPDIHACPATSTALSARDKGFFYQNFQLDRLC